MVSRLRRWLFLGHLVLHRLTDNPDYNRFIQRWAVAHSSDGEFTTPFPENRFELPSDDMNGPDGGGDYVLDGQAGPSPMDHV